MKQAGLGSAHTLKDSATIPHPLSHADAADSDAPREKHSTQSSVQHLSAWTEGGLPTAA